MILWPIEAFKSVINIWNNKNKISQWPPIQLHVSLWNHSEWRLKPFYKRFCTLFRFWCLFIRIIISPNNLWCSSNSIFPMLEPTLGQDSRTHRMHTANHQIFRRKLIIIWNLNFMKCNSMQMTTKTHHSRNVRESRVEMLDILTLFVKAIFDKECKSK